MQVRTEKVTVEASGDITLGAAATLDGKNASGGFYPPQIATASLPTASTHEGMVVYDTTLNKLVVSNGSAWETITSS